MAYLKISKHHYFDLAADRVAFGLLVVEGAVNCKDHIGGYYYYAFGIAAIGSGVLFVVGI